MNPLKVKASGSPITSANISGLQTMTDGEVKNYIANVITEKFASVTDGTGTAEINIATNTSASGTSIGVFTDTVRTESIGTSPATGAIATTVYYAKQITAVAAENITNKPLAYGFGLEEMSDNDIDSTLDLCINAMVSESSFTAGLYKLQPTAPSGGTWVARYTLSDTAQGGNTETFLWQKTVASSAPTVDLTPLKAFDGGNCKQMTEAEIEQMLPVFKNRIIETGIGTYKIQSTAPENAGTYVQMGDVFEDTRQEITPQNYVGNFSGVGDSFTGVFSGTAQYSSNFTDSTAFTGVFSGTAQYSSNFTGTTAFTGVYSGTAQYAGFFSGPGQTFSGTYVGTEAFVGFFSGPGQTFSGTYVGTAQYVGPTYTSPAGTFGQFYIGPANYTGFYTGAGQNFAGSFAGSINYTGFFSGSANYTGFYTGAGQNFAGSFAGSINYTGFFSGPANYTGFYSGPSQGFIGEPFFMFPDDPQGPGYDQPGEFGTTYTSPGPSYTGFYAGPPISYEGTFAGTTNYTGFFSGPGGTFSGTYVGTADYAGFYTGPPISYIGFFTGPASYTGFYEGPGGNFVGYFEGSQAYTGFYTGAGQNFTGFFSGPANYTGFYTGPGETFTGFFSGPANYTGFFTGPGETFTGFFTGTENYSGFFSATGTFSGNFSGATIQATKETVSTVKLWIRIA